MLTGLDYCLPDAQWCRPFAVVPFAWHKSHFPGTAHTHVQDLGSTPATAFICPVQDIESQRDASVCHCQRPESLPLRKSAGGNIFLGYSLILGGEGRPYWHQRAHEDTTEVARFALGYRGARLFRAGGIAQESVAAQSRDGRQSW